MKFGDLKLKHWDSQMSENSTVFKRLQLCVISSCRPSFSPVCKATSYENKYLGTPVK